VEAIDPKARPAGTRCAVRVTHLQLHLGHRDRRIRRLGASHLPWLHDPLSRANILKKVAPVQLHGTAERGGRLDGPALPAMGTPGSQGRVKRGHVRECASRQ
jgi:hypothetical protein